MEEKKEKPFVWGLGILGGLFVGVIILGIIGIVAFTALGGARDKARQAAAEAQQRVDEINMILEQNGEMASGDLEGVVLGEHTLAIDTEVSSVVWTGQKTLVKNWIDKGSVAVQSGNITFNKDGIPVAGEVVINMKSITATQTGNGGGFDALAKHLSSPDFFDVEKYPTATFVLTDIATTKSMPPQLVSVKGNMTIKGVTREVSFPVEATKKDEGHMLSGKITLDRTDFDVRFGSGKFFENLGDNVIDDMFTLDLALVTK